ncbi:39S ribosomal protein L40, mitochondrial isoform X2 [Zootermopsis nevadensis]|uniref:39S ribosomal protein L40, mitochondrial isoform X2 n=1 Tax=Zootermopsis nevadensis TaxID=136037 RepID=UPI000B8E2E87|nr:39S ribosomal protein L40, mitochondrial isoform X2 [Zootermopsis nevadensis]
MLCISDVRSHITSTRLISTSINPLLFKATTCLYAEPLKKKKRIDPAVIKHREERKKKRLEKQIRRLEKNARQLKPIDELEVPLEFMDRKKEREREVPTLTPEMEDERAVLLKKWATYKQKQHLKDTQMIDRLIFAQQKALDELHQESEELYEAAIQINPTQIPFIVRGPVQTPPIKGYDSPDGEFTDVSKKW